MINFFIGTIVLGIASGAVAQVWSGELSAELLMVAVGFILSMAADFIPGFRAWYGKFNKEQKGGVMLVIMLALGLAAVGIDCAGWVSFGTCGGGFAGGVQAIIAMIIANQMTHYMGLSKLFAASPAVPVEGGNE